MSALGWAIRRAGLTGAAVDAVIAPDAGQASGRFPVIPPGYPCGILGYPAGLSLNFPSGGKARIVEIVAPDPGRCTREIRGGTAGLGFFMRWEVHERHGSPEDSVSEESFSASIPAWLVNRVVSRSVDNGATMSNVAWARHEIYRDSLSPVVPVHNGNSYNRALTSRASQFGPGTSR